MLQGQLEYRWAGPQKRPDSLKKQSRFLVTFLSQFQFILEAILRVIFGENGVIKWTLFLIALGGSPGSSWGPSGLSWGALLGGLVFLIYEKREYEAHIFENEAFRYCKSLGALFGAILAHFGLVWTPKWRPKFIAHRRWDS